LITVSADILMVGEVAETLFFHEHVVNIVKVVLSDKTDNSGEDGGDTVLPQARCEYRDGCRQTGQAMVGKVAATLFIDAHVVIIVKVVLSDGTSNVGEGGGNTVPPQARCDYRDCCRWTGQEMVGTVAATLFFRKHVVGIMMVTVGQDKQ